jgi:hypothetical protein
MNRNGEKGVGLARFNAATGSGAAFCLSLASVVAGLALSVVSFSGVCVLAVGAAWFSWMDFRRRPADDQLKELSDRIDAMQSKINSLTLKVYGQ